MPAPALSELPRRLLGGAIRVYQLTLSGLIGRQCRYLPTCSDYAAEAVATHGAWPGAWMAMVRVCRCHPWGGSGYDPPPSSRPMAPWYAPWRFGASPPRHQERANSSAARL